MIEVLTFDLVDDICLGLQSGALTPTQVPSSSAESIGPLYEMAHTLKGRHCNQIALNVYEGLLEAKQQNRSSWFHAHGSQGFSRVRRLIDDPLAWNDLSIRASRAAQKAGFSKSDAWKLIAAIGEIYGNIVDHSERIESGYVAFATNANRFEFVIGDEGIGILSSLRKNPVYAQVADAGTALECALSEGVSSFLKPGHGLGFQPIFIGLANISTRLRFRTGDYGRQLQRRPDGTIPATTMQLATIEGFFCSVLCTAPT